MLHLTGYSNVSPSREKNEDSTILIEDDLHNVEYVPRVSTCLEVNFCHIAMVRLALIVEYNVILCFLVLHSNLLIDSNFISFRSDFEEVLKLVVFRFLAECLRVLFKVDFFFREISEGYDGSWSSFRKILLFRDFA